MDPSSRISNATWVCFACREALRRPTQHAGDVTCPGCGLACRTLGTRVRIPPRRDVRGWNALRARIREQYLVDSERGTRRRVRRRHDVERRIAALGLLPPDPARVRMIRRLREQLDAS